MRCPRAPSTSSPSPAPATRSARSSPSCPTRSAPRLARCAGASPVRCPRRPRPRPRPPPRRAPGRPPPRPRPPPPPPVRRAAAAAVGSKPLVFIASSTGGPAALARLVPQLPGRLGAGTVIVQHMPAGFTTSLAARLDNASALEVVEAKAGELLAPDKALLGPGGLHLRLDAERRAVLSEDAPIGGLRPRADLAIEDAAKLFGRRLLLVVLTGMGNDGVAGARAVRAQGGRVLIQEESPCPVYGMPRAVAEAGLADAVFGLDELPAAIAREVGAPPATPSEGAPPQGRGTAWA